MSKVNLIIVLISILATNTYAENTSNCIAVSSDGEKIYKLDLLNYVWVIDERWKVGEYYTVCISPSGKYLAYQRYFENGFCITDHKLDKTVTLRIDADNIGINSFSWNPNEEYLALSASSSKNNDEEIDDIYLYNLKTNELKKLSSSAKFMDYPSPPAWNNDGNLLYYINKDDIIIEFDITNNISKEIAKGQGVYWISDLELLIRKKRKYYLYNLQSKDERYLFKLGGWQYPPIALSPDKKIFLCWDTRIRRFGILEQRYTAIREFPSGKTLKVISNYGQNQFSWYWKD